MSEELLALAERVESATGPDRLLDAMIAATLRVGTEHAWGYNYPAWEGRADGRVYLEKGGPSFSAPAYTASLDAAMSLVPEGWCIASFEWWPMTSTGAGITLREVRENDWGTGYDESCGDARARGSTPALCITAAALRALSLSTPDEGGR